MGKYLHFVKCTHYQKRITFIGGWSVNHPSAAHPLENIGLVCIFMGRMFIVRDPLFECMN